MEAKKVELKILIISLAAIISIELVMKAVIPKNQYLPIVILGAARLFETSLMIMIFFVWGKGMSSVGLAPSKMIHGLKKGLIWSACFGIITSLVFAVLYTVGQNPLTLIETRLPSNHSEIILFFLIGGFIAPITEEIFFRGILYGFFRRWGVLVALILSTLLFVLVHPIGSRIPLPQVVGGIVFAVSYEMTRSLLTPITIHILGNTAIFTLSMLT
jgi:membrane protease YdiL (CAAX protease family)